MPEIVFKITPNQIGEWLYRCDDVEFAEAMVSFWKMRTERTHRLTEEDFESFPIKEFGEWVTALLSESIPKDSEYCKHAWWKGTKGKIKKKD